jgi:serine/threonine protein kinase
MTPEDLKGLELDSAFLLVQQIGEGGMGRVFEAEQYSLQRRVAVKIVSGRNGDIKLKERFLKEMKAAGSVKHQNLVPVYTAGYDHGFLYIAMELIDGMDLSRILIDGPLEVERAMTLFRDVARALQCIHNAGYVHRDVKPANILVAEVGAETEYALLADLGIAKAVDDPDGLTKGQPPGTPLYMAPETVLHWKADSKSDQYSLGCVLFEMLAGRPPFISEDGDIADQHIEADPPDVATLCPSAPDSLREALRKALSKDPDERYPTILDFYEAAAGSEEAGGDVPADQRRLTPVEVSRSLFGLAPDRDERASQLAMETFLTLWANGYEEPSGDPSSPKRRNAALRSLVLGENFVEGFGDGSAMGRQAEEACERLASGKDFAGSDGLALARRAIRALIDDRTIQGSSGSTLLAPFHESLLWYDARRSGAQRPWSVRKVNMRGTGVTLGAMLLRGASAESGSKSAVAGIKEALQSPSPVDDLASRLRDAVPDSIDQFTLERDEVKAWEVAGDKTLAPLAERINRHCRNITAQEEVSPSTKLLQIRLILALDVAHHMLARSWEAINAPEQSRFLLLSFSGEERKENEVRIAAETSYQNARQQITQAIITQLAVKARNISEDGNDVDWDFEFEKRAKLGEITSKFGSASGDTEFRELAGLVFEESRGSGYGRPVDAFRVLLESIGVLNGTGQYRYLRAGPELLAALIGAVGDMPMPTGEFLEAIWHEWSFVVGDRQMTSTFLVDSLDGSVLARNSRILEALLSSSGLAVALSDQTCMVGHRLGGFK